MRLFIITRRLLNVKHTITKLQQINKKIAKFYFIAIFTIVITINI